MKLKQETIQMPDGTEAHFEISSGNIFADLGLPNPEERLLKANLAIHISQLIEAKKLTQVQAAQLAGVGQPHLSNIIRGRLSGYSVEKLLSIINHLGRRVEVRIGARDVKPERAITAVHMGGAR